MMCKKKEKRLGKQGLLSPILPCAKKKSPEADRIFGIAWAVVQWMPGSNDVRIIQIRNIMYANTKHLLASGKKRAFAAPNVLASNRIRTSITDMVCGLMAAIHSVKLKCHGMPLSESSPYRPGWVVIGRSL